MSDTIQNTTDNKRIAKNTILLYIRMAVLMAVNLYTSRIVLEKLGVEDFGIYTAVAGFVSMFSLLSGSLTTAISRFLTFELGKSSKDNRLNEIFSTSINIQFLIGIIIFLLCETIGLYFLNKEMNIPEARLFAANWVLQFSVITFFINMISVPYNALIIAHERMSVYAYLSIFQGFATLSIAFFIDAFDYDYLIIYSGLLCLVSIILRVIYSLYCNRNFEESEYRWIFRRDLLKEMFGFAGWNFIGASSSILRTQGVNVLMNIYCGPIVNAARGLSMQVNSAVQQFSNSFTTALNPQITKQYASGNNEAAFNLVFQGARFTVYLFSFLAVPLIFGADIILNLWLHEVPYHTVSFVRLVLIYSMIESLSTTLTTLSLATGNIRNYQLFVGGIQLLHFPFAWIVLSMNISPEWTYVCAMFVALCCLVARLFILRKMVLLPIKSYFSNVILNVLKVLSIAIVLPMSLYYVLPHDMMSFLINSIVSLVALAMSMYFVGCKASERQLVKIKLLFYARRLFKR
ncbi:MAG: lipopolysaccharide biosynthesis protein [Muribaculaceae bacterium]